MPLLPLLMQRCARSHNVVGDHSCPELGRCHWAGDNQDINEMSLLQLHASISLGQAHGKVANYSPLQVDKLPGSTPQLKALLPTRPDLHGPVASGLLALLDVSEMVPKRHVDPRLGHPVAWPTGRRDCFLQNGTFIDDIIWIRVSRTKRLSAWDKFKEGMQLKFEQSIFHFFASAEVVDWTCFVGALFFFMQLHKSMLKWPDTRGSHSLALLIWMLAGGFYNLIIWARLGTRAGKSWLTGYWLEFIFSIENVFIFQVICRTFQISWNKAKKALIVVVCCQLLFQMIFYMGLATLLIKIWVLPYFLGAWLIWVAFQMLKEDVHTVIPRTPPTQQRLPGRPRSISPFRRDSPPGSPARKISEDDAALAPIMVSVFRSLFGDRFVASYGTGPPEVFSHFDGQWHVTLLLPAMCCLLAADFMMEIDVTLTKIVEIQQPFIAFTSSMAAAFAVPDLFFVAQDLLQHFRFLKYGVTFVLIFFGGLLLLHRFIQLHDMVCLGIIAAVMAICMLASYLFPPTANEKCADVGG